MFTRLLLLGLLCLAVPARSATLFSTNSTWRFLRGTNEASLPDITAWRNPGFNDAAFADAPAPFWYGDPRPGGTQLLDMQNNYTCIFLRKTFVVNNADQVGGLALRYYIDDGLVMWINGTEVYREGVTGTSLTTNTLAANQAIDPAVFTNVVLAPLTGILQEGVNTIAVQVFNTSAGSSDLGFDCVLQSIISETVPPVITAVSPAPGSSLNSLTQLTVTFSESVVGVNADDLLLNTQPALSVTGSGATYTFSFPQPLYGNVSISWFPTHGITDEAVPPNPFDANGVNATWQYTLVDAVPPVVTAIGPPAGITLRSLSRIEVSFSEEVNGVDASDLLINDQPATSVTRQPGGPYSFLFPQPAAGTVNLRWAVAHGIADQADSPNAFAGGSWTYVLDPNASTGDVVINEILVSNASGINDPLATPEDPDPLPWIELYNRGTGSIDLAGWSLTDDPDFPTQWVFPSKVLQPGQYLVVFASGLDIKNPTGTNRFHTNFKMSRTGEFLGLYTPDSPPVLASAFEPTFPEQRNDISYGRDAQGNLRYFTPPTPGRSNGVSSINGVVSPVHFSTGRGFFTQPFQLVLTCPTPGALIRFTIDGSEPTATTGTPYVDSLRVSNTTVIRAAAFRTNLLSSRVTTHSFLFNLTPVQRSIPVMNVVTATNNLIGRSGIIGMNVSATNRTADGAFRVETATEFHNPSKHGLAWEKPVSVEYILPDGSSAFQIDAGIRVQGSDWQRPRTTPTSKFSFRLYFRSDYGSGKLNYPIFPVSPVQSFDQMVLRAGFNEQINPFIRDEVIRRMSHDMGQAASHGNMALLLLNNGPYTNNTSLVPIYNPCERVHEELLQAQLGGGEEWDVVGPSFATGADVPGVIDGDRNDFNNLMTNFWSGSAIRPITNPAAYLRVAKRLDLANFVDYCLLNSYVAMGDWPANNWRAGRDRTTTNSIWRYIAWDAEWGMGIYGLNTNRDSFAFFGTGTEDAGLASISNSEIARTYQALRPNPEFRLLWADRIHKHLFTPGGALTSANISNRINQLKAELISYIPNMESKLQEWPANRPPIFIPQLNTYGLYGFSNALYGIFASSNAPAFNQRGGTVVPGFALTMTAPLPGSLIYYTTNGDDPRVMFTGAVSNSAVAYAGAITLNQSTRIRARSLWNGTNWSAINEADFTVASLGIALRLTELMYNPTNPAHEFLEIQNFGSTPVDLGGMTFEGITYGFNVGNSLAGGARLVLASDLDPAAFAARYPGVAVFGYYGGGLNNGGERIALKDRNGNYIFTVDYDDAGGWPTAPDGGGSSLELTDVFGDPDDPANWHASATPGGSPGAANSSLPAPTVRLNEIYVGSVNGIGINGVLNGINSAIPLTDPFVEIQNTGGSPVNLAGWSLTDDGNARKFVFSSVNVAAGGYLVVWCDDTTNTTPGIHTGFSLQRGGDNVYLFDPATNRIDALTFGLQLTNHSVGRIGAGGSSASVLTTPTPGADNSPAALAAAAGLSINEWQASAPSGQSDWIELHNTAAQPVALRGCYLTFQPSTLSPAPSTFRLSSLSFIPAFGFVQLFADEGVGPDHLDFKLAAAGGTIVLYDSLAAEVNRVSYTNAVEGLTRGRLPDGTANIVNFPGSASPGASNFVNTYTGAVLNEVLARNRSAVTNAGNAADYVELFNPNGTAFPLLGMSLSVGSSTFNFPASAVVPANGYLVIWCDGLRPASFAAGDYNTGRSLDGESGGVYLFNALGQVVNSVEYGFQVRDLPIGLSAGQWRLLAGATPGAANSAPAPLGTNAVLRFNEWMANPVSGADWFELFNPTIVPVDLGGLYLTDDPSLAGQRRHRVAPLSFIGPAGFVKWIADGDTDEGRNHVNFSLEAQGESLWLYRSTNSPTVTNFFLIDSVTFDAQQLAVSEGRLPDGQANIVNFIKSTTPGESNYLPLPSVVINEVLTHTDPPLEDAVELRNTGASVVGIGGWFLSNSQEDFKKYRLPDGTSIAPGGFAVIYQNQFSNGSPTSFTFDSAHGDEVWLSAADANGNLTGYRAGAKFGAAENGVSFGRVVTSVGVDYAALAGRTFGLDNPGTVEQFRTGAGLPNAAPLVGPVVINELMYHPQDGINFTSDDEYIELRNVTGAAVPLYDPANPANTWKIADGVDFIFPPNVTLAANGFALVVPFDPANAALLASFRTKYGVSVAVPVFGPYDGKLDNAGENVELLKPDAPAEAGTPNAEFVPYVLVDRVDYRDSPPWPSGGPSGAGGVDGGGLSLQRQGSSSYGNEPLNWRASTPTPGVSNGTGIVPAPIITASPQSQTVLEGDVSTLAVTASGAVPLGYRWRFNGTPVPNATNSTLLLDYVVLSDEGEYDCVVSNPGGAALSAAARLGVQAPAVVLIPPTSITNRPGSNIVFTVGARGSAPLRYQWRLNGVTLSGETNATLVRNNIQLADDGEYEVLISNAINTTMASARLVVLINTTIVTGPAPVITVVTGALFTVSVSAAGNPLPFSYEWRQASTILVSNNLNSRISYMTFRAPTNLVSAQVWRVIVRNLANQSLTANAQFNLTTLLDSDSDGIPDNWESNYGFNPGSNSDRDLDSDGDGMSNVQEYYAGTDPTNALSRLSVSLSGAPALPTVSFLALSNRTYTVQFTDNLGAGSWLVLSDVVSRTNNRVESVTDPNRGTNRSYRVVTPRQP